MTAKRPTYMELYRTISTDDRYAPVRWIANVLLSCGKKAARLRGLKHLVDTGHEVGPAQFIMPYEAIVVNGRVVVALVALDAAAELRLDLREYGSKWYLETDSDDAAPAPHPEQAAGLTCPLCRENDVDRLVWVDGDEEAIACQSCGSTFLPAT